MRRHVAGQSRIAVVPPGSAEVVALLQDGDVAEPRAVEQDRLAQPGHPGADYDDPRRAVHQAGACARGASATCIWARPRSELLMVHSGVPITSMRSTRSASSRSTALLSIRARLAPRHRWLLAPNATWEGLRVATNASGLSNCRGSRLAAPHSSATRAPAGIVASP